MLAKQTEKVNVKQNKGTIHSNRSLYHWKINIRQALSTEHDDLLSKLNGLLSKLHGLLSKLIGLLAKSINLLAKLHGLLAKRICLLITMLMLNM